MLSDIIYRLLVPSIKDGNNPCMGGPMHVRITRDLVDARY